MHLPSRSARWFATMSVVSGIVVVLAGCGGGSGGASDGSAANAPPSEDTLSTPAPELGPYLKVVPIGTSGAVLALFPDGQAYYSPDGLNLGGGGSTVSATNGQGTVVDVVAVNGGVDALMSDGTVFFSPDGQNLVGGGGTVRAEKGGDIASLTPIGSGVDAVVADGGFVYYSPDGLNLDGGGGSVSAYPGGTTVSQIVPTGTGNAVLVLFADGRAFYSPDNRNLGGGGNTTAATTTGDVARVVKVGGGILAQSSDGHVRLVEDGQQLDSGGVAVESWVTLEDAPFAPRDSAHGAVFAGRLWVSGGFSIPSSVPGCTSTCSYYDLWSSTDLSGTSWNTSPSFATATEPNPRDLVGTPDDGLEGVTTPTDFYDAYSALVVWNGELTAIGATVWRSADGVSWHRDVLHDGATPAPGPLPVAATENTRALLLGNAVFVIQTDSGEVYRSTDASASTWTDLGPIAGFAPRCGPVAFVLQGRIWVEGGGACDYSRVYNEIWSSADGVHWTQSPTSADWSARMWPCVAASPDGVMWLATGFAPTDWNGSSGSPVVRYGANHSDAWYSRDGIHWQQFKADLGSQLPDDGVLEPRHAPTCFVTGDAVSGLNLLIVAGSGGRDPSGANARTLNSIRTLPVPTANLLP
jgi:hypothetical protein